MSLLILLRIAREEGWSTSTETELAICGGVLVRYARRTAVGAECDPVGGRVDTTGQEGIVCVTTRKGGQGNFFVLKGTIQM